MSKSPECTIHVEQNIYQPFKCALTFHQLYHRESKIHRPAAIIPFDAEYVVPNIILEIML